MVPVETTSSICHTGKVSVPNVAQPYNYNYNNYNYCYIQWHSQRGRGVGGFKPPPLRKLCIFYYLVIEQKQWLIIKIVATRCRILGLKCIEFRLGLHPKPR